MIVSGGENVFPREVEELLVTHPRTTSSRRRARAGSTSSDPAVGALEKSERETELADALIHVRTQSASLCASSVVAAGRRQPATHPPACSRRTTYAAVQGTAPRAGSRPRGRAARGSGTGRVPRRGPRNASPTYSEKPDDNGFRRGGRPRSSRSSPARSSRSRRWNSHSATSSFHRRTTAPAPQPSERSTEVDLVAPEQRGQRSGQQGPVIATRRPEPERERRPGNRAPCSDLAGRALTRARRSAAGRWCPMAPSMLGMHDGPRRCSSSRWSAESAREQRASAPPSLATTARNWRARIG